MYDRLIDVDLGKGDPRLSTSSLVILADYVVLIGKEITLIPKDNMDKDLVVDGVKRAKANRSDNGVSDTH